VVLLLSSGIIIVTGFVFCNFKPGTVLVREKLNTCMKNSRKQENKQSKQGQSNKPVPEIRDNMDSRHNKEDNQNNPGISRKKGNKEPKK
jgi:hypothetical protein